MRLLFATLALLALAFPASAERIISSVSRDEVAITSSFTGETLTLFGNIEPEAGAAEKFVEGPYHIIIVVTGPRQDRVARLSDNRLGFWMNNAQVIYRSFPSYYFVLASGGLSTITSPEEIDRLHILPAAQADLSAAPGQPYSRHFGEQLVRLMTKDGFIGVNETGIVFRSNTFYAAQVNLPSDSPPGPYLAHSYLFKNGALIAERSEGFTVRKTGFERFLALSATQQPLFYGLVCVILALFTGWLGGVVFRR